MNQMSEAETLQQFGADKLSKGIRAIEARAAKFKEKGMTQANFAIGVANILFLAWCFGALQSYLWIIYVVSGPFLQLFVGPLLKEIKAENPKPNAEEPTQPR